MGVKLLVIHLTQNKFEYIFDIEFRAQWFKMKTSGW